MYKRILIVVGDIAAAADASVTEGVALARAHEAEIVFFTAIRNYEMPLADYPAPTLPPPGEVLRQAVIDAKRAHAAARVVADRAGVRSFSAVAEGHDDGATVAAAGVRLECDLIVAASHRSNAVMRLLRGSLVPGLITRSQVPVLIVKDTGPDHGTERSGRRSRDALSQAESSDLAEMAGAPW